VADERDDTERSEDPTQKRLDEALERGDVAKSQEVNTWFVLAGATLILLSFSGSMSAGVTKVLASLIGGAHNIAVDGQGLLQTMQRIALETIAAVALPFALLVLAAIAGNMVQHRLVWSAEQLKPKLSKISPAAGFKRLFQYRQWYERQKMSVRELKEEFKQTEGDPAIKAKIRQLRQTRMKKRMMAAVPKASVIITNPTHYAIALQYERGMNAPVCLAKGIDNIALKIREVAAEHRIPVVENPPLARALHATVEIDEEVPPEHYKAVAEVIGYVMRLRGAVRA